MVASKADLSTANASINKNGDITLNAVNAIAINSVTENGQALNFSSQQFRLDNGKLVIGMANLNTPSRYFVALEQANGQFTHISFSTFTGSVGLGFLDVTPDQASPTQADSGSQFAVDITDGGTIQVNENSQVSIGTQSGFTGTGLSFSASGLPSGLSINASSGVITGTTGEVDGVESVSSSVTVTATAGDGSTQVVRFTVVVVNLDKDDELIVAGDCTGAFTGGGVFINQIHGDCFLDSIGNSIGVLGVLHRSDAGEGADIVVSDDVTILSGGGHITLDGEYTVRINIDLGIGSEVYDVKFNVLFGIRLVTVSNIVITFLIGD